MGPRIKKSYQSLYRSLDLEGNFPSLEFESNAVPVVIIHEHCEGDAQGASASQDNAGGPLTIASVTPPRTGAYQIMIYGDWNVAIAAREAMSWRVQDPNSGTTLILLRYLNFGNTGMTTGHFCEVIPKIHLEEGVVVNARLDSAIAINDNVTMGLLVVPI